MASNSPEEARLTQYLLDDLSPDERQGVEEAYFNDDEAFQQMLLAEDELLDSYARAELSAKERLRVEQIFMASQHGRERLQFAVALANALEGTRPAERPKATARISALSLLSSAIWRGAPVRIALASVALALVLALPWLLIERSRRANEVRRLRDESASLHKRVQELEQHVRSEQARNEELRAQLEGAPSRQSAPSIERAETANRQDYITPNKDSRKLQQPSVLTFILSPGLVRGEGARVLAVPPGTSSIVLKLNIEEGGPYLSYRTAIETAGGRRVWSADGIKAPGAAGTGGAVTLPAVPAKALWPGDYVLLLSGKRPDGEFESVADYSFRVAKK